MHYLCTVIKTNRNMTEVLIEAKEVSGIMTKSNLPVGGYSVNPYVGCTHACKPVGGINLS